MFPKIISGGRHIDNRGELGYNNSFNFWHVKRFILLPTRILRLKDDGKVIK